MQNENHGRVSRPVGRTKPDRVHIGFLLAVFAALAALVFLAGCVTDTQEPGDSPSPPILVVEYTRTGGIAAFNDRLVVFENGQAVYSRGNKTGVFTVPPASDLGAPDPSSECKFFLSCTIVSGTCSRG